MIIVINKKTKTGADYCMDNGGKGGILEYRREEQKRVAKKGKNTAKKSKKGQETYGVCKTRCVSLGREKR